MEVYEIQDAQHLQAWLRRAVVNTTSYSHQGIFGGDKDVVEKLKEHKLMSKTLNISLLKPKAAVKGKGKPRRMGLLKSLRQEEKESL